MNTRFLLAFAIMFLFSFSLVSSLSDEAGTNINFLDRNTTTINNITNQNITNNYGSNLSGNLTANSLLYATNSTNIESIPFSSYAFGFMGLRTNATNTYASNSIGGGSMFWQYILNNFQESAWELYWDNTYNLTLLNTVAKDNGHTPWFVILEPLHIFENNLKVDYNISADKILTDNLLHADSTPYTFDNASWNQSYANTLYAPINETLWTSNYTLYNNSWSNTTNLSYLTNNTYAILTRLNISTVLDMHKTANSTYGIITQDGTRFIHNYGTGNLFIGLGAGNTNLNETVARSNTAIGQNALSSLSGGVISGNRAAFNLAIGTNALTSCTTCSANFALGDSALTFGGHGGVTTQDANVAIGSTAGYDTTASQSVFIGNLAGRAMNGTFTATNYICIGYNCAFGGYGGLSNVIGIGSFVQPYASNQVILGNANIQETILRGLVRIPSTMIGNATGSVNVSASGIMTTNANINQTNGNFTGNQIYGEMWFDNDTTQRTTITSTATWYNISFNTTTDRGQTLNGVNYNQNNSLICLDNGLYDVTYSVSGQSDGANKEYNIAVSNGTDYYHNTETHQSFGNADVQPIADGGLVRCATNLNLYLRVRQVDTGAQDFLIHQAKLKMVRVGN